MTLVVLDPSGSFNEGKGHTGITIMRDDDWSSVQLKSIAAKDYSTRHEYWDAVMGEVLNLISERPIVIVESFMIRNNGFLIGKMPETIRLIGAMEWEFEKYGINYIFQTPSAAKSRFKDEMLVRLVPGFEARGDRYYFNGKLTNDHMRDALKHLLYYRKYGVKKK